jgi:hypothetical protein
LKGEESYSRDSNQEQNVAQLGHDPNACQNNISPSPGYDDLKMENQLLRSLLLKSDDLRMENQLFRVCKKNVYILNSMCYPTSSDLDRR